MYLLVPKQMCKITNPNIKELSNNFFCKLICILSQRQFFIYSVRRKSGVARSRISNLITAATLNPLTER